MIFKVVKDELSLEFIALLEAAFAERQENQEHDTNESKAWNALVSYAMDLEKG